MLYPGIFNFIAGILWPSALIGQTPDSKNGPMRTREKLINKNGITTLTCFWNDQNFLWMTKHFSGNLSTSGSHYRYFRLFIACFWLVKLDHKSFPMKMLVLVFPKCWKSIPHRGLPLVHIVFPLPPWPTRKYCHNRDWPGQLESKI